MKRDYKWVTSPLDVASGTIPVEDFLRDVPASLTTFVGLPSVVTMLDFLCSVALTMIFAFGYVCAQIRTIILLPYRTLPFIPLGFRSLRSCWLRFVCLPVRCNAMLFKLCVHGWKQAAEADCKYGCWRWALPAPVPLKVAASHPLTVYMS